MKTLHMYVFHKRKIMLNNKVIIKKCKNGLKALLLKAAITDMSLYDRVDNDMVSNLLQATESFRSLQVCT